jgi:pyruvate formate lyase activating enzyme
MPSDHGRIMGKEMTPTQIVEEALNTRSATISYTYTEPTVYFELSLDTARIAVSKGLKNVFVSNGYMTEDCLKEIYPDLHAANIDLKAFSDKFYRQQCGARLGPVLKTLETIKKMGIWLEVTTLLIPGLNDSEEELRSLALFLAELDPNIPWHISRFHPTYRLTNTPPTSAESLQRAREYGYEAGLKYVYTGNLPGDKGENTFCHECGELLIDHYGFYVTQNKINKNCCPSCDAEIPGVWS